MLHLKEIIQVTQKWGWEVWEVYGEVDEYGNSDVRVGVGRVRW